MVTDEEKRERNRRYQREWYQKNKKLQVERSARYKKKSIENLRAKVLAYLQTHPCVDCGETDVVVLEFDHVSGEKLSSVSEMIRDQRAWNLIEEEIAKCEVRCANDHKRVTAQRGNWWKMGV